MAISAIGATPVNTQPETKPTANISRKDDRSNTEKRVKSEDAVVVTLS